MQTLPNQESLLQNQVFLVTQYSSTYLRFPYRKRGEGAEGQGRLKLAPMGATLVVAHPGISNQRSVITTETGAKVI
jgi:hypothetical protein